MPARQLPDRPNLEQYKKQAKELLKAWTAGDPAAVARMKEHHPGWSRVSDADSDRPTLTLADTQFVIAREHGFESWPKFAKHIEAATAQPFAGESWGAAATAVVAGDRDGLQKLLDERGELRAGTGRPRGRWTPNCAEGSDAGSIIAREHFFQSWAEFAAHGEMLKNGTSAGAQFEAAVEAVVSGEIPTLKRLLRSRPELVRARSRRTHHATLLHYVGANGVEGFRQRSPKNAVDVADALLAAGADVNAMADMYGGADTLGLVATSIHPIIAGVQEELMEFLLHRGASVASASGGGRLRGAIVNGCLANGRPSAAEYLANRGAPLDLEAAAGLGRIDLVTRFFGADGSLAHGATEPQMKDGFSWACEYGRTEVVGFLLERGVDVSTKLKPLGQTGLHWAAYGGHADTVRVLLQRRAPVDVKDERFGTTPLSWALYAWCGPEYWAGNGYYEVVEQLVRAGATVNDDWLKQGEPASPLVKKVNEDARMRAILTGTR